MLEQLTAAVKKAHERIIVDYQFYQDNSSDTALVKPAIERLVDRQQLAIGNWP
jgi:hypothetical protein